MITELKDGRENVEAEFLEWWRSKDFSGYPWTREEVKLIALLAWRNSREFYQLETQKTTI